MKKIMLLLQIMVTLKMAVIDKLEIYGKYLK